MKKCVIMPLFTVCGNSGSLGECAYKFTDRVAEHGVEYWLLPALGDNYPSAIDLDLLRMDGLVTVAEIKAVTKNKSKRDDLMRKAFSRFWKPDSYAKFESEHREEYKDDYEMFLRYEFIMQYNALVNYALSRGVTVTDTLPHDAEAVYF